MRFSKSAFTLVELLVAVVIIGLLVTVGFFSYEKYINSSRDAKHISQLKEISSALKIYGLNHKNPFPIDYIELQYGSGNPQTYAYQGYVDESIGKIIGLDIHSGDFSSSSLPVYLVNEQRKDFQLLVYIQDNKTVAFDTAVYPDTASLNSWYPVTQGTPYGILLEQNTQIPIHARQELQVSGVYNISSGTGNFIAYLQDNLTLSYSGGLGSLYPFSSCERVKQMGKYIGKGEYNLNRFGTGFTKQYCDI